MKKLLSRKLVTTAVATAAIVGIVLVSPIVDADKDVIILAIGTVAGLGGYQITRQAIIDERT